MINYLIYNILNENSDVISQDQSPFSDNLNQNQIASEDSNQNPAPIQFKMRVKRDKELPKLIKSVDSLRNHVLGLHNPLA